jgi:hypothetical protein
MVLLVYTLSKAPFVLGKWYILITHDVTAVLQVTAAPEAAVSTT